MLPLCRSAGRDLSFLSGLRPELPGEKEVGVGEEEWGREGAENAELSSYKCTLSLFI